MIRFSIFSIPVEIQPFFWVTLVILGGVSGADTAAQILEIGLFVIAGFVSILIHELGHALTARWFGANSSITLQAFGGYATYSGTHLNRWKSFLVTAAGPLAQIALAFMVLFIMQKIPNLTDLGSLFLSTLIFISFFWAILNLLPVLPLDGGQMLNAALGPAHQNYPMDQHRRRRDRRHRSVFTNQLLHFPDLPRNVCMAGISSAQATSIITLN